MKYYPIKFPKDLWDLYAQTTKHPGASLRYHAQDALNDPSILSQGLYASLSRQRQDETPIQKGIDWPHGLLERITDTAQRMHLNKEVFLRLVLEGVVARGPEGQEGHGVRSCDATSHLPRANHIVR